MATVIQIRLSLSNSFLVVGERPILVDTGSPKDGEKLLRKLAQHSRHLCGTMRALPQATVKMAFGQEWRGMQSSELPRSRTEETFQDAPAWRVLSRIQRT